MVVDEFTERLAKVRHRFMSTLESKIGDTFEGLPSLTGDGPAAVEAVDATYRRIHNIVGVGPTVGFVATGAAARKVESVLFLARHAGRGLNHDELKTLKPMLNTLRDAAQLEIQSTLSGLRS